MDNNKWIDKSVLPRNKSHIDWKHSVGIEVPFRYNEHEGILKILDWRPRELTIQYGEIQAPIKIRCFEEAKLARALNFRNYDWIYDIGSVYICDDGSEYDVVDREERKNSTSNKARFYKVLCRSCKETSWFFENDMGTNCPICNNRKIIAGKNDLWTTNANIAKQLLNPKDGELCSIGKRVYLDWKCPTCGEIIKDLTPMQVYKAIDSMVPCPSCSDGYSYPNKLMFNILSSLGIEFENEKNFKWKGLGRRKYDFYLSQFSMIIEMHGIQHYEKTNITDLEKVQKNDEAKKHIAIENNIKEYIVIDASISSPEYIFNNIVKSRLPLYIDIKNVDLEEVQKKSLKRIRQRVFEVLEEVNYDISETAEILKIDRATVSGYLNDSIRKGLIEDYYVRECQRINKIKKHYQKEGQPYHCIELDLYFGSGRELKDYFRDFRGNSRISVGTIVSQSINGNGMSYGFSWERVSRETFNELKISTPEKCFGDSFIMV